MLENVALLLLTCIIAINGRQIRIVNRCDFPIWPAWYAKDSIPFQGGEKLMHKFESIEFEVPDNWTSGRIWARTSCDQSNHKYDCETGSCGPFLGCGGNLGDPGPGVAWITLTGRNNTDYYHLSFTDGFNIPMIVRPVDGDNDCDPIGTDNWATLINCPEELKVWKNNRVVLCASACNKFRDDEHCCTGKYGKSGIKCWMNEYTRHFTKFCPNCHFHKYDRHDTHKTCKNADYEVLFC